jgi:hypothetical protein
MRLLNGCYGLEISYDYLNMLDMSYLLSNYEGFCDGDKRCVVLVRKRN